MVSGNVVFSRDVGRLYYAVHKYIAERLRTGELPLWYPYEGLGVPFIASAVTAVFHPLSWLSVIFGPIRGMWTGHLIAVCVAVAGAWFLARKLGTGKTGAAITAISFGGAGTLVSMLDNQPFFLGPVAFPWLLLGTLGAVSAYEKDRTLISGENGLKLHNIISSMGAWIVLGASALGWIVLAGDMQGAMVMGLSTLMVCILFAERGTRFHAFLIVAVVGCLGTMISAVQLMPSIALSSEMERSAGFSWEIAKQWSLHPVRLTEFFMPHQPYLDDVHKMRAWLYPCRQAAWNLSLYMGITVMFGCALSAGFIRKDGFQRWTVISLFLLSFFLLWMALGHWGGIYRLVYDLIPFWDGFRYPEKLAANAALPLALLGGIGIDKALESPRKAALTGGIMTFILLFTAFLTWIFGSPYSDGISSPPKWYMSSMSHGALRASLISGVLCLGFYLIWKRNYSKSILPGVFLVALVLFDLAEAGNNVLERTTAHPLSLEAPSLIGEWLREEGGIGGIGDDRITTEIRGVLGLKLPEGIAPETSLLPPMLWTRHTLEAGHASSLGFESTRHYLPVRTIRQSWLEKNLQGGWFNNGVNLYSGRYLIINLDRVDPREFDNHRMVHIIEGYKIAVLEHLSSLPRLFLADPLFIQNNEDIIRGLTHPDVSAGKKAVVEKALPDDWKKHHQNVTDEKSGKEKLLGKSKEKSLFFNNKKDVSENMHHQHISSLENSPVDYQKSSYPSMIKKDERGKIYVVRRPELIKINVELSSPSLLVLNDAWWPGWTATVNNKTTEIHRVNYLVMGVLLYSGSNEIVFKYKAPKPLKIGALLSFFSILICGFLAATQLRYHKHPYSSRQFLFKHS